MSVQQRLQLAHLEVRQVEDIRLKDRPQLDMTNAALAEHVDLHLRVGADFVGESTEGEHGQVTIDAVSEASQTFPRTSLNYVFRTTASFALSAMNVFSPWPEKRILTLRLEP